MLNFGLENRVVMVTGGASGIGKAIAELAAGQKCHVVIMDVNYEAAELVASKLASTDCRCLAVTCDVRDPASVEQTVKQIEEELGPIDGLVTSAGVSRPSPAETMPMEKWATVLDINLTGSFLVCQAVGRRMIERRTGSIVAISSVDGFGGHANRANYTASKFGIAGMVKSLAIDWGRHGVRVNAVAPGIVDTPLLRANLSADHVQGVMCDRVPMARLSTAEDQANVCLFLLSDAAAYVTGAVIPVDGGLTAGYFTHLYGADAGAK